MITLTHLWGLGFIKIYEYAGCLMLLGCFTTFKVFYGTLLLSGGLCMNYIRNTSVRNRAAAAYPRGTFEIRQRERELTS